MTESRAVIAAREELEDALKLMDDADVKIQALAVDTPENERDFHKASFERAEETVSVAKEKLERAIAIQKAKEEVPPMASDGEPTEEEKRAGFSAGTLRIKEPNTYRVDNTNKVSFFRDLMFAREGDQFAQERLQRHNEETRHLRTDWEGRDVTAAGGAAGFVPPLYMGELWAEYPREGRPFANALRNVPLPSAGLSITIPRLTTGTAVATQQTEADAPQETNADDTLLTVPVRTIAGMQDLSIQAAERTDPGFDAIIAQDLQAAYDQYLDQQLLHGTGANGQHLGVTAVSSINTSTYTDASPTGAEALPKVYDLIQQIASGRFRQPDIIVMHPRRAAFFASSLSSTFPLFQQGQLNQAAGVQDGGFLTSFAGLRVIQDANITTTNGNPGTNQDQIIVVYSRDPILLEGPLRVRVLNEVLSGTLQVRIQVFAYSAFASGRQPESIGVLSGTGLAAPSF